MTSDLRNFFSYAHSVTVTEALVLRPLLEDLGRITVNLYLGAHRQNETKMFSDHDKTSLSIAAVSAPSVACSMLTVQQQKMLRRQFVGTMRLPYRYSKYMYSKYMYQVALTSPLLSI